MSIITQKLGRTVYYMLKRKEAFNPDKFYGGKKIENKDSGGEHLAYVASRRLHEKKLFKSPLSRLAHNWSVYGGVRVRRFQPHLSPVEIAKNKFN